MISFTTGKYIQLAAAICGVIGTFLLYFGSFTYEAPAAWVDEQFLQAMVARNKRRRKLQRAGLCFLLISFSLTAIGLFFE